MSYHDEQFAALNRIKSICQGFHQPNMAADSEMAWAIAMCKEIVDQALYREKQKRAKAGVAQG